MSDPVLIGLISTIGLIITSIIVEFIRRERMHRVNERKLNSIIYETTPNHGKSMRDLIINSMNRIERKVDTLDERQRNHGERIIVIETQLNNCLDD